MYEIFLLFSSLDNYPLGEGREKEENNLKKISISELFIFQGINNGSLLNKGSLSCTQLPPKNRFLFLFIIQTYQMYQHLTM